MKRRAEHTLTLLRHKWEAFKLSAHYANIIRIGLSVIAGLFSGFVFLLIVKPSGAFGAFFKLLTGGLSSGREGVGYVLYYAAPMTLAALSVGFSKKAGQFNAGVAGQYTIGAVVAVLAAVKFTGIPLSIRWLVALILAISAGAVWGLIPAVLKVYRKVDVFISGMLLNFIAMYAADWIIKAARLQSVQIKAVIPSLWLDKLFNCAGVNIGIIIAPVMAVAAYIAVNKTVFGFEMKAVSSNIRAARNAGVNDKRVILITLGASGALAGLGGSLMYLSAAAIPVENATEMILFALCALAVAAVSLFKPLNIIFSSLMFGYLAQGSTYMAERGFSAYIIGIMFGVMMYMVSFAPVVISAYKQRAESRLKRGVK